MTRFTTSMSPAQMTLYVCLLVRNSTAKLHSSAFSPSLLSAVRSRLSHLRSHLSTDLYSEPVSPVIFVHSGFQNP
jgi:hypothetical protein